MTNHHAVLRTLLASVVLLVSTALAACTPGADAGVDEVVLVVAPTMGSSAVTAAELAPLLAVIDEVGDRVVVVTADGAPEVTLDYTIHALPDNAGDRTDRLEELRMKIATSAVAAVAKVDEVDISEGIALGAEAFSPTARRTLTVFASGMQTTGLLSLLDGRLYAEPRDLVTHVEESGGLPDLAGVAVSMPTLGVTVAPQPPLNEDARTALSAIWSEYMDRAGAVDVDLRATDLVAEPWGAEDLPKVTPVPVSRPEAGPVEDCRREIGTDTIGFAVGSAEVTDPVTVRRILKQTHDALGPCEGDYLVEGSASSEGDPEANAQLSLARARAVADILAAVTGTPVPDERIVGWGSQWPCRVPDLAENGALILDAAIANRTVVVSKGDSTCPARDR